MVTKRACCLFQPVPSYSTVVPLPHLELELLGGSLERQLLEVSGAPSLFKVVSRATPVLASHIMIELLASHD